jgi:protein involved in polysaccharide export with SLBB domain
MRKLICIFLMFCLLPSVYCLPAMATEYILSPNDQLEIKIIGKPDLTTKQVVTPDGSISLPVIGRIKVEGLTLRQLDEYLTAEFSKYITKPQIIVYLIARPFKIQIRLQRGWEDNQRRIC